MILYQNDCTTIFTYDETAEFCFYDKLAGKWCCLSWALFGRNGYLSLDEFKAFPDVDAMFCLCEGVIRAIKRYQQKLGLETEEEFVIDDTCIWKCPSKGSVKYIYSFLVQNHETKCPEKWSQTLNISVHIVKEYSL